MRKEYPVTLLCQILNASKSGYYAYLKRPKPTFSSSDKRLITKIKRAYKLHEGTYGAKRIASYLKKKGTRVNHKRVARLMREINLKATVRQPKITHTRKIQSAGYIYENRLQRDFQAMMPNVKWVTDVTEVSIKGRKLYVSAIMDLFNREILALKVSASPNAELIKQTLLKAKKNRKLSSLKGITNHSDQGNVYRSFAYFQWSKELGFTLSMSRKANCWDNAVIESFFSTLKVEVPCFFPTISVETLESDLLKYISYFNEKRSQKRVGYQSPKEYLTLYKKAV
ncbi:IS3 family transposase [Metabacillus herbersteinensis]|uniref:IS3 family transposase n=1 Tax=Metabacillus herbersteinensis TaxID=283816 RepID=A0ABV6GF28_9BACI